MKYLTFHFWHFADDDLSYIQVDIKQVITKLEKFQDEFNRTNKQ